MRHRVVGRKLNRTMEHRKALFRNMVTSLIVEERIETTLPRAKELRRVADRMVTLGKKGTLHARRQALSYVRSQQAVQKLFSEIAERFAGRSGGYTRILKLGHRQGDGSPMAIIEYLDAPMKPSREERRKSREAVRKAQEETAQKAKKAKKDKKEKKEKKVKKTKTVRAKTQDDSAAEKKKVTGTEKAKGSKGKRKGVIGRVLGRRGQK